MTAVIVESKKLTGVRCPLGCHRFVGHIPFAIRYLGCARKAPQEPDGTIWLHCEAHRQWLHFEVVYPEPPNDIRLSA